MSTKPPSVVYGKPPLVGATFTIAGRDFDIDLVTEMLGVKPSSVWHQRHEHLRKRPDLDTTNWSLSAGPRGCYSVSEVIEELLIMVAPLLPKLAAILSTMHARASVVANVTVLEDRPLYELSPLALRGLAELNCDFLLDIHDESK